MRDDSLEEEIVRAWFSNHGEWVNKWNQKPDKPPHNYIQGYMDALKLYAPDRLNDT